MIWVDLTNSPHALFFEDFIKNHDCVVTAREFGPLTKLLDGKGVEYTVVGRHGGGDPKKKLVESVKRTQELVEFIGDYNVDVAVSKHSVELPRVAFGLKIPCIHVLDNEFAEHQNRLTLPLASSIIVPEALDETRIMGQGARKEQIRKFRGVCEYVHVKNFSADDKDADLGLNGDYVIIRPAPYMASYFGSETAAQDVIDAVNDLGMEAVVLPRGEGEFKNAVVLENVNSLKLIYNAKALLSGGGTMNRESALLGTPTISFYSEDLLGVDKFLIENGLMSHATSVEEITKILAKVTDKKAEFREKAKTAMEYMEDPFDVIAKDNEIILKPEGHP